MVHNFTSTDSALDESDRTLWLSVLEQAIRDARSPNNSVERGEARRWLTGNGADFRLVCTYAGLDPAYMLRRVRVIAAWEDWFAKSPPANAQAALTPQDVAPERSDTAASALTTQEVGGSPQVATIRAA